MSDRELANSLSVRLDFLYFTGLIPTAKLPDYRAINKFRNLLIKKNKLNKLLKLLNEQLSSLGLIANYL